MGSTCVCAGVSGSASTRLVLPAGVNCSTVAPRAAGAERPGRWRGAPARRRRIAHRPPHRLGSASTDPSGSCCPGAAAGQAKAHLLQGRGLLVGKHHLAIVRQVRNLREAAARQRDGPVLRTWLGVLGQRQAALSNATAPLAVCRGCTRCGAAQHAQARRGSRLTSGQWRSKLPSRPMVRPSWSMSFSPGISGLRPAACSVWGAPPNALHRPPNRRRTPAPACCSLMSSASAALQTSHRPTTPLAPKPHSPRAH